MKVDRYTKILLTIIAVGVGYLVWASWEIDTKQNRQLLATMGGHDALLTNLRDGHDTLQSGHFTIESLVQMMCGDS